MLCHEVKVWLFWCILTLNKFVVCLVYILDLVALTVLTIRSIQVGIFNNTAKRSQDFETSSLV